VEEVLLFNKFLQRAAMLALQALYYLCHFRPSVRPSHAGIVSKRRHVPRCSLRYQIAKLSKCAHSPWNLGSEWPTLSW